MRSKFKRKQRALLRDRYEARELEKLKKITARINLPSTGPSDLPIKEEVITIDDLPGQSLAFGQFEKISLFILFQGINPLSDLNQPIAVEQIDVDSPVEVKPSKPRRNGKSKDLKNEHGNYPEWMSQRRVKKIKRCGKSSTSSKGASRGLKSKAKPKRKR